MKNALKFFYNLNATEIHQVNMNYKFRISNNNYLLNTYERTEEELNEIYILQSYLISLGIKIHQIIPNKENKIITVINNKKYILLKILIENRKINLNDIMLLSNIYVDERKFKNIKRINWYKLWSEKIDYIEYQITQFGKKYNKIRESCDYYIGLVENCIQLIYKEEKNIIGISHNRTKKDETTEEYYNPLNFILDNRIRDISEYTKSYIIKNIDITIYLYNYIYKNNLTQNEIRMLFIRILYPSIYIDTCEEILENKKNEEELKEIIEKTTYIEEYIKKIYSKLKKITNMPDIEWLVK
jgi:hypothetical protein